MRIIRIGVKYCGGCNPLYDRVALLKYIENQLKDVATLQPAGSDPVDFILAVQGCEVACADLGAFKSIPIYIILKPQDTNSFLTKIQHIIKNSENEIALPSMLTIG